MVEDETPAVVRAGMTVPASERTRAALTAFHLAPESFGSSTGSTGGAAFWSDSASPVAAAIAARLRSAASAACGSPPY